MDLGKVYLSHPPWGMASALTTVAIPIIRAWRRSRLHGNAAQACAESTRHESIYSAKAGKNIK